LQRKNQFTRYFDQETNEPLNNSVGLCNRAINCGHHYTQNNTLEDLVLQPIKSQVFYGASEARTTRPFSEIPLYIGKEPKIRANTRIII
jgi:hypothetical protein